MEGRYLHETFVASGRNKTQGSVLQNSCCFGVLYLFHDDDVSQLVMFHNDSRVFFGLGKLLKLYLVCFFTLQTTKKPEEIPRNPTN